MIQNILSIQKWLMEPNYLRSFLIQVQQKADMSGQDIKTLGSIYMSNQTDDADKKPYAMDESIATIKLHGPTMKRARGFMAWLLGIQSMENIGNAFKAALADDDVAGIFLDIDSPGGTVDGTMDLANIVYEGRGKKPILSFADGQMTSAAAWIGSGTDFTAIANETTRLGSVGVYGVHFDYVDRAKDLGITPTIFHSGSFKRIGNELEHLTKADKAHIQKDFDYIHGQFIDGIARNTGIAAKILDKNLKEAMTFLGSKAIDVGLGSEVMSRDKAMELLKSVADGETSFEKRKATVVKPKKRVSTKRANVQGDKSTMQKIEDLSLKGIIETVCKSENLEDLKTIEDQITAHCSGSIRDASNHIERSEAVVFEKNVKQILTNQRRKILAAPEIARVRRMRELGERIGRATQI